MIYEPESLLAIGFIDGLTRDGEMNKAMMCLAQRYIIAACLCRFLL